MQGFLFIAVIALDQVTKSMFTPVTYNTAGVFGVGGQIPWIALTTLLLGALFVWWRHSADQTEKTIIAVVFASGLSNVYDRVIFGGVRDFIWWPIIGVYGNVADLVLAIAVAFFLSKSVWYSHKSKNLS